MAIANYRRPQLIIQEDLEVIQTPASINRYAFVFGPQYWLARYTVPAERALMSGVPFVYNASSNPTTWQTVPYEGLIPTYIIDEAFVQLYGEMLEGQYWLANSPTEESQTNLYNFELASLTESNAIHVIRRGASLIADYSSYSNQITGGSVVFGGSGYPASTTVDVNVIGGTGAGAVLRMTTNSSGVVVSVIAISPGSGYTANVPFDAPSAAIGANVGTAGSTLIGDLYGRPVQAGDILYVTLGDTTFRRTVTSVQNETVPSTFGTDASSINQEFAPAITNPTETDAASFGSVAAPPQWGVVLNHETLKSINLVSGGTSAPYSNTLTTVVISAPLPVVDAIYPSPGWPVEEALATPTLTGGVVTAITLSNPGAGYFFGGVVGYYMVSTGSGYTVPPTVAVTAAPAGGINAVIQPILTGGGVYLQIVDPGHGYTSAPTITISGGNGSGASSTATAILSRGVNSVTVTNTNGIYTANASGDPTNGGTGLACVFSVPSSVLIADGATRATGYAVTNADGTVVQLVITNTGAGYNTETATVTITPTTVSGTAPTLLCVMGVSPVVNIQAVNAVSGSTAAELGSATAVVHSLATDWNGLVQGSSYNGQYGERYTITVTSPGTETGNSLGVMVRVRSASGGFSADGVTPTHEGFGYRLSDPSLGGLIITLMPPSATSPLTLGQQFSFVVVGKYKPLELAAQGQVTSLSIVDAGSGYTSIPTLTFSSPPVGGTTATAIVEINSGLSSVDVTFGGTGYASLPTVVIDPPVYMGGIQAVATVTGLTATSVASIVVDTPGAYTVAPTGVTFTGGGGTGASITSITTTGSSPNIHVTAVVLNSGGSGYTAPPTISAFTGGTGTAATAHTLLTGTSLVNLSSLNIITAGSGYDPAAPPTVTISSGSGTGATAVAVVSPGSIISTTITNPGNGYLNPPAATLSTSGGTGGLIVATISTPTTSRDLTILPSETFTGSVNDSYQITVIKGDNLGATQNSFTGAIIQVADTAGVDAPVQITVAQGVAYPLGSSGLQFIFPSGIVGPSGLSGGSTATATAVIVEDELSSVIVNSGGSGYVVPPVITISGGDGSGALATAILENGVVVAIVVASPGSGYNEIPTVTIAAPVTYQGGLRTGDVYFVNCVASAATGPNSIIVLSGSATDITGWTQNDIPLNLFNIDARVIYSGALTQERDNPPNNAWNAGTTAQGGIILENNLDLQITSRTSNQWVPVKNSAYGRLFSSWRGLVPSLTTDEITLYTDTASAISKYGIQDLDNPICYGLCIALDAANGIPVYAISVPTDDATGFATVLNLAANTEGLVFLAPQTSDAASLALLPPHVTAASEKTIKLWRRAYITTANPGPYAYLVEDENDNPLLGTVLTNGSGNVRVMCEAGNFITFGVLPGDLYRTQFSQDAFGNPTYNQYVVQSVLEEDELVLVAGPATPITPAIPFQLWRANTGTNEATFIGDTSNAIQNRRICNIWCDAPYINPDGAILYTPLYYIAAEIAGLRSSLLPQQGLSRTALQYSVAGCPNMYRNYQQSDLDIAAENGTWIITQDSSGTPVYIRHQLTTDSDDGILYYEDSVGVNLDDIAYQVDALLAPYPGQRNVNVETLEEIETKLRGLFDSMTVNPVINVNNIGPQLIAYSNLLVTNDPNFLDQVNVQVNLQLPVPLNVVNVTLYGTASPVTTTVTTQITQTATS